MNSADELFEPATRSVRVERDASAVVGRPLIFFADLVNVGVVEAGGAPFALTNADVFFASSDGREVCERVIGLRQGEAILSRRLDVVDADDGDGRAYRYGYDFFAARSEDVVGLADPRLVFGAPWWDQFFPLALHMRGCVLRELDPVVRHLVHDERWSWKTWEVLGWRFVRELEGSATDELYRSHLRATVGGLRNRLPRRRRRVLHLVSDLNLSFISEVAVT